MASNKVTYERISEDPEKQFGIRVVDGFEIDDEITSTATRNHTKTLYQVTLVMRIVLLALLIMIFVAHLIFG